MPMEEIIKKIEACQKCSLCKSAKNRVIGRGSLEPRVLFIGEAPGENEDKQGIPFCGKSGELLDRWIAYLELKKGDFAVINVCKCRPPDNRAPKPEEMAACAEFTMQQIEILNPSIIVPLGRTATSFILGSDFTTISECAGKSYIVKGKVVFPIFHPSYYLRNGKLDTNPEIEKLKKELYVKNPEEDTVIADKELIENFAMNIQICEQLSYAEMISPILCAVHNFCKMAGMQFIDKNQRDICLINGKLTLLANFSQTNEFDLFAEDLNEGGKYHRIETFIFYVKEGGNFSFLGFTDREIVDSLEMGFHFKASKDCKKIMLDTLKPMNIFWRVYQEIKTEKRDAIQPFAHLHLHSEFSLGDGYGCVSEIAHALWKKGFNAAAITDHGTLAGTIYFQKALKEKNIKPILGMEAYIVNTDPKEETFHITLLVKNETGWKNLLKIQNNAVRNNFYYRPKIKLQELLDNSEGLIAMSACVHGIVAKVIDNEQQTEELIGKLKSAFGDDLYIEMMPHNEVPGQIEYNKKIFDVATEYGIKMVVTCDCHYPNKEDKTIHNAVEAINRRKKYGEANFSGNTFYYMQKEEIEQQFMNYFPPYMRLALDEMFKNTLEIVDRCNFEIKPFTFNSLPSICENPNEKLRELAWEGLRAKGLGENPVYKERMELELNRIIDKDYAKYFLIVWDYVNFCKNANIQLGAGRGSVGASLLAWCIGITTINPIEYDLMFDRFISAMRKDAPDIDLDFEDSRREELIEYLSQKHGENNVAKIATYSIWHGKGVVRDIGRIFDLPADEVDKVANLVVVRSGGDARTSYCLLDTLNEFEQGKEFYAKYKEQCDIAIKLESKIRHCGVHAAGQIVCSMPLDEIVPLRRINDVISVEWEKEPIEELGLIKFDILGLKTLTVIKETLEKVGNGVKLPEEFDDPKVYDTVFKTGKTLGIFQFETTGLQKLSKQLAIDNFKLVYDATTLYRPGPLHCLNGSTNIKTESEPILLRDLYKKYVAKEKLPKIYDGKGNLSTINRVFLNGWQETYKLKTKNRDIIATQEHRFLTKNGWKRLKELKIGDKIIRYKFYAWNKGLTTSDARVEKYVSKQRGKSRPNMKINKQEYTDRVLKAGMNTRYKKGAIPHNKNIKGWGHNMWLKYPDKHPNAILNKNGRISYKQKELFEVIKCKYTDAKLNYMVKTKNAFRFLDVAVPELMLDFEYDGEFWHNDIAADTRRDIELENLGWKTIRINKNNFEKFKCDLNAGIY